MQLRARHIIRAVHQRPIRYRGHIRKTGLLRDRGRICWWWGGNLSIATGTGATATGREPQSAKNRCQTCDAHAFTCRRSGVH